MALTLKEAEEKLANTTFLLSGFHHKAALKFLAETDDLQAVDILAKHLGAHPQKQKIKEIISGFTEEAKKNRVWQHWVKKRKPELGSFLKNEKIECTDTAHRIISLLKLGHTSTFSKEKKEVKDLLEFVTDSDKDIKTSVFQYLKDLPNEEGINDMIYSAWLKTESTELEDLFDEQNRRPSSDEREALFYLVRGKTREYLDIKDDEGEVFSAAYIMASKSFKTRINKTVLKSQDRRLTIRYRKALGRREDFDPQLYINALKEQGNEDGLFEATRYLSLDNLLDLCERWRKSDWAPEKASWKKALEVAMVSFSKIEKPKIEKGSPPPKGTEDILSYWENQQFKKTSLQSKDPFVRAGGMYTGIKKNSLSLEEITKKEPESWPEVMTAGLLSPGSLRTFKNDHIGWLKLIADFDYTLLTAKVECKPDEYDRNKVRLSKEQGNTLSFHLLSILVGFQGVFGGWIVVEEDDSAREKNAIEVEEMEDAGEVNF